MSYFDGSEFAPYIDLCRHLNLERHGEPGDWRLVCDPGIPLTAEAIEVFSRICVVGSDGLHGFDAPHHDPEQLEVVWLPRLDQWLAILRAAGITGVGISPTAREGEVRCVGQRWPQPIQASGESSTPEEAAARLWMEIMDKRDWV